MTKHTPGPWALIPFGGPQIGNPETGAAVCTMWGSQRNPEDAANARLIAAAPALLAALQAFMPELDQREHFISANDHSWSQSERDMLVRIQAARKAVRDAGGEA